MTDFHCGRCGVHLETHGPIMDCFPDLAADTIRWPMPSWPFPHRFTQHPQVTAHAFCGVEKYPDTNPGSFCVEKPGHPLHDWFCERCGCVVSGAHAEHPTGSESGD